MALRLSPRHGAAVALALVLSLTAAPAAPVPARDEKSGETPAEKVRKALDQNIANLEIDNQQLMLALEQLREETKITFVLDRTTIAQTMGLDVDNGAPVRAKLQNVKARTALRNILNQYSLSYAIVGDSIVISSEEMAVYRQLKQRVSLDLDRVPAEKALRGLARETATNLLVDNRAQKDAQNAVSLQVDDVPLETAVRLIAEAAGLKPVRMGNVLLVTTKAHATELRSEPDLAPSPRVLNPDMNPPPGIALPGLGPAVPPVPPPAKPADKPAPDKPQAAR
jgi:type II secretory pathway component HofQ